MVFDGITALRNNPRFDMSLAELLRLEDQMLLGDVQVLKEWKQNPFPADSIQDWIIIRNRQEGEFDKRYVIYMKPRTNSVHQTKEDGKTGMLAVLAATLVSTVAGLVILRTRLDKPLVALNKNCIELLAESGLTLPAGSTADPWQSLNATIKLWSDTVQSLTKHEKAMIENAVDMVCWLDASGRFQKVSPSCKRITGYTEYELHGTPLADYLQSSDANSVGDILHAVSQSTDLRTFENWFKTKFGNVICLRWSAHLSVSEGALFCIAHDITDSKLAERLLKEKEAELRLLFESLPAGILVLDSYMNIELNNSIIEEMLDYRDQSHRLSGKNVSLLLPDMSTASLLKTISESDRMIPMLDEIACASGGERVPVQVAFSKFATREKWLLVVSDMRSKVAIETMKREFIAMVGHDLRTPLTSIRSFFELLSLPNFEVGPNQLARMIGEVERLMRLISDLLDIEKMRAGKFELHTSNTHISALVDASINAVEHMAITRKISIRKEHCDFLCLVDGARTIQVLVNLLSNALKFSSKRSEIVVGARDFDDARISVYVSDHGRGIPADQVQRIFERFSQVCATDASEKGGSGLGLHICKTIINEQGGEIWVEPNPEGGSTFCFTLMKAASD